MGRALCFEQAGQNFGSRPRPPGISPGVPHGVRRCLVREPQEIEDEEHEQIVERVAAVDVAKVSGILCTRVPHPSRPVRRHTRLWDVDATRTRASSWVGSWQPGASRRSRSSRPGLSGVSRSTITFPQIGLSPMCPRREGRFVSGDRLFCCHGDSHVNRRTRRSSGGAMLETCGSAGKGVYLPGDLVEVSSKIGGATPVGKVQPDAHRSP